jgi:hypothetical protein
MVKSRTNFRYNNHGAYDEGRKQGGQEIKQTARVTYTLLDYLRRFSRTRESFSKINNETRGDSLQRNPSTSLVA